MTDTPERSSGGLGMWENASSWLGADWSVCCRIHGGGKTRRKQGEGERREGKRKGGREKGGTEGEREESWTGFNRLHRAAMQASMFCKTALTCILTNSSLGFMT